MSDLLGLPVVVDSRIPEGLVLLVPSGATRNGLVASAADDWDRTLLLLALLILGERNIPTARGAVLVADLDAFRRSLAEYANLPKGDLS